MNREHFQNVVTSYVVAQLLLLAGNSIAGSEDRTFERQRLELVERIESLLINNNICQSRSDCQSKKVVFVSPASSGVSIKTYRLKDTVVMQQIAILSSNYFFESKGNMQIEIEHYYLSKETELSMHFWESAKPVMSVRFKGDK